MPRTAFRLMPLARRPLVIRAFAGKRRMPAPSAEEAVGMHIGHGPECADIPTGYVRRPDGTLVSAVDAAMETVAEEATTVKATIDTTKRTSEGEVTETHEEVEIDVEKMTISRKLAISGVEITADGPQSTIKPEAANGQRGL